MSETTMEKNRPAGARKSSATARAIAVTGVLSAAAFVLQLLELPAVLMPSFIKMDFSELPALVDSYIEEVVKDVPEIKDSLELDEVTSISENSYTVRLTYMINEAERESATIRLRNAMNLLLEGVEQKSTDKS